ncbi:MAG: CsgG/HfaB family protein, partial [Spirochaetaceae bacterium]|nr:CsgG/HfaB family protein [Spirochaetaceae bacterium]
MGCKKYTPCKMSMTNMLVVAAAVLVVAGCASSPRDGADRLNIPAGQPFFSGDGGSGLRIAVLQPKGVNIPKGLSWCLSMIQGSLTGDFDRYSEMTVLDRRHLDEILEEQNLSLTGDFSDDDYIRIGNLTNAEYILTGSLTQAVSSGAVTFYLELAVSNPETGERRASFGPKGYTLSEIQNMKAAKDAAHELLARMGVELSASGRAALYETVRSSVEAETALAKGVTAQNSGDTPKTTFEAMYYLFEAQSLDPSLIEAVGRLEAYQASVFTAPEITVPELSVPVRTGNIARDAQNELAQYKAHQETLKNQQEYLLGQRDLLLDQQKILLDKQRELTGLLHESEDFYRNHPPFEIIYDPVLERTGEVNYQKETINLQFRIASIGVPASLKVMQSILDGLEDVKLGFVSINSALDKVQEQLDRVNEAGKEYAVQPAAVQSGGKTQGDSWTAPSWMAGEGRTFTIEAALTNEQGKTIGGAEVSLKNELLGDNYTEPLNAGEIGYFRDVPVNDMGDVLKLTIKTVNGVDVEDPDNTGYIRISAVGGTGYTASGYNIDGYSKAGLDPFDYDAAGYNREGFDRGGYGKTGYDKAGHDMAGRSRQENAGLAVNRHFDNAKRSGISIFFAFDPFSLGNLDEGGAYVGFGGSLLFGRFGVWSEIGAFIGKSDGVSPVSNGNTGEYDDDDDD